ncbi:MAG: response regulator, partial [Deltaproteobacteria bacterium]|nr:response regulator [Deltaproteobacteria bacterium]
RLMLEFMADLFKEQGHVVVTAEDGLSALEALKDYVPDVAFVDLVMPNIRGDRLCRIIRSMPHLKHLFLVILSATALEDLTHFAELGADASLAKGPFNEMSKQLLNILDQRNDKLLKDPQTSTGYKDIYQRRITKELLFAERHLETILNHISEGIFELNPDGKIIFCNNKGFSLSGSSETALLGRNFFELFEGKDRQKIEDLLFRIGDGPPEISDKFPIRLCENGVSLKLLPVEDHSGWSVIAILTPLDRTENP